MFQTGPSLKNGKGSCERHFHKSANPIPEVNALMIQQFPRGPISLLSP